MIFNIIGLIIGVMIFAAGIYYFLREKEDNESRKIYSITTVIGALILVFMIIRLLL
ncbi:MAG: hypothetical protein Q4D26_12295 [Clostridia bacterium]|nr:hypothetical protein [Clostridia bacterium]